MRRKIDQETADRIRELFRDGAPGKVLAHQFGIGKSTVSMIVNNLIWVKEKEDAQ